MLRGAELGKSKFCEGYCPSFFAYWDEQILKLLSNITPKSWKPKLNYHEYKKRGDNMGMVRGRTRFMMRTFHLMMLRIGIQLWTLIQKRRGIQVTEGPANSTTTVDVEEVSSVIIAMRQIAIVSAMNCAFRSVFLTYKLF